MVSHDTFPPLATPEAPQRPKWYEDGIRRTVRKYPPQKYAPGGSYNVLYDQPADTFKPFYEEPSVNPAVIRGLTTAIYGVNCMVTDLDTGQAARKHYYVSHAHGVILVDNHNGTPLHPVRLDGFPRAITIGGQLPTAEMSSVPANPRKNVVVESVMMFADDVILEEDGSPDVRPSPFIAQTLPEGAVPREDCTGGNPLVALLPRFEEEQFYDPADSI